MTSRQAKEILLLYRPGTADREDPEVAEAISLAEREPELTRWFEEHCRVQETLRARFTGIAVPEGLKEQIISERKVHLGQRSRTKGLVLSGLAVAAAIVVAAVLFFQPGEDKSFSGFQHRMLATVREYPRMDLETNDLVQIHNYLAQKGRGDYQLPATLAKAAGTGCKALTWQNKPVSMICFNSGTTADSTEPDLFLFVVERADVPGAPRGTAPEFAQTSRLTTATWSIHSKTYLLGTFNGKEVLEKFL